MARRARIVIPGVPLHIIQRGNNRQTCFFTDDDYEFYLDWLQEYSYTSRCLIHAYVLMPNHIHLLLTPHNVESAGDFMKRLGQRYVQYINRTYDRTGTLWEGRFRSGVLQQEIYLLICQRYIEMNPVRAEMVKHPREYRWSSYSVNAQREFSEFLTPHPMYQELSSDDAGRGAAYRKLFRYKLKSSEVDKIRKATNGNYAVGSNLFQEEAGIFLGRRVCPGQSGRPRKLMDEILK